VQYPAPVKISGKFYWTLDIYGDKDHILQIASTMRFATGKRVPMQAPDISAFLPRGAGLEREINLDFENDGIPEIAFDYATKDPTDEVHQLLTINVLKFTPRQGWSKIYEHKVHGLNGYFPLFESVTSAKGEDGLLVTSSTLGPRVVSSWFVVALVENKLVTLDPMPERIEALRVRGYANQLSQAVVPKGDFIVDEFAGSTKEKVLDRWKEPILVLQFRFTGSALHLASVKQDP